MKIESVSGNFGGFSIVAENPEERSMLYLSVAALEAVFPNTEDRARPTQHLLLLEVLRINADRMELSKSADSLSCRGSGSQ